MLRQGKAYIIATLLSAALLMTMMASGAFRHWRESLIDFLYTQRRAPAHTLIVEIDENTITKVGQWPLPRSIFGMLVSEISEAGAATIGIDINFKESSGTAQEDSAFARSISNARAPVVLTAEIQPDGKIIRPVGPLSALASQGFPNIFTSSDGVVRFTRFTVQDFPSFALTVARAYQEHSNTGGLHIPVSATRIAFPGPAHTFPSVSAVDVLDKKIPDSFFKDRIVLIGATAKDLQDYHQTPFDLMSGVEIQSGIAATLVDQHFYQNHTTLSFILTGIFSLVTGLMLLFVKRPVFFVLSLIGLVCAYSLSVFIAFDHWRVLDLLYPNLGFLFTGAMVLTAQYSATAREKKHIHETFSRYLAPQVIKELMDNPDAVRLGGKKEELTILFSDIRNFTTISETMGPEQLTSFLNQYLSRMTRVVLQHEGVIDKYIGDAIMAFWGAPLPNQNHARDGIVSALEMIDALAAFNRRNQRLKNPVISIGIGINSGDVTVGNMGSEKRFDYTVIGDNVNLASRLEGLTKTYDVSIIIGEQTHDAIKNDSTFLCRELDRVLVKGKKQTVRIFEVVPPSRQSQIRKILPSFNSGREAYYQGHWDMALEKFSDVLAVAPQDGPTVLLQQRAQKFQKKTPTSWEGVFELTHK